MSSLQIIRPIAPVGPLVNLGHATSGLQNLLTPDPKEIAVSTAVPNGDVLAFGFDMGAVTTLDSFFMGFTSLSSASSYSMVVVACPDNTYSSSDIRATVNGCATQVTGARVHFFAQIANKTPSRYWAIVLHNDSGAAKTIDVGVLAVGLAFAPTWGQEMGAGRGIEDMSSVDRTFGGGFEIDEGAIVANYQWTFGDLSLTETRQLNALARQLGNSRSLLVAEGSADVLDDNEALHWALFDKLDFYERNSPNNCKWSFKVRDWG